MVPVVLTPRPMAEADTMIQPAGRTVRAMLRDAVEEGRIEAKYLGQADLYVDGVMIPRDEALDHVLAEGEIVNLIVHPHGGGGGGGKDVGQILLQVAVIAVSMWVGGGAGGAITSQLFARVAAAAVMVAGNMALSAIYAPKASAEKANDRYALQSASNSYRQWGMMPLMLGPCVVAPDLAVKTFTRAIGDDVWIYGILSHHFGPCQLDELKIGDTLVSSMGEQDVRFVHHLTPGPRTFTLVPNDIDQVDLAPEELTATPTSATPVIRASASTGEQFELDFYLPAGLYFQKDDGRKIAAKVTITVRYRAVDQFGDPVGSGAWTNGLTIPLTGSSKDPLRITRTLNLPEARYEFEVKRSVLEDNNEKRHTDVAWSAIRAISFRKPVTDETLSISEFAVRATALNQGSLAPITCKITPLCPTWTGTEWGPPVPTANPAALTRWLLTGPAPAKPLLSVQADVALRAWSVLCDQYNWEAHIPLQEDRSQAEAVALLERAGRAGVYWDGTQVVGTAWVEKPVPKQMFTGVNLKSHRFEIAYADPVHAFRVEFQNLEQRGEADEIMVYNDGYAEFAGVDGDGQPVQAASLVEALRLEDGQKTPERAYRDARWELGRRKHQRRFDSWSADIEAVVCRYGNRVRLAWSRAGGEGGARVRTRRWSEGVGSTVTGLRLDREIEMTPGVDYVVDLRLVDQLLTGVPVVNEAVGETIATREVRFVDPRTGELSPRAGDMVAFGPAEQVTEDVEILGLEPGDGLTADLMGVRYVAPLLMAGETGPIPELQTRLTLDRLKDPPAPTLLGVQVEADGVRVGFSLPPWKGSPVTAFTVRWRVPPGDGEVSSWQPLPDLAGDAMILMTPALRELPGEDEVTRCEIEIRAVTRSGQVSRALAITAVSPAAGQPPEGDWVVTPMTSGPDGSRQSGFLVIGTIASLNARRVTVEFSDAADGPWVSAFDGPPVAGVVRASIVGVQPGSQTYIAITYWTAQAVAPSARRVMGPYAAPSLVADVMPNAPGLADIRADITAAFGDIFDLSGIISQTRTDLEAADQALATAIGTVGNRADTLEQQTASLEANKASVSSLNAQVARIDNAEAVNAQQALTLVDLENGKVSLSDYNTLKGEVTSARDGAPSLLGQIQSLKSVDLDLQNNKASVASVNALTARTALTEADIIDLENGLATEAGARAQAIQQVSAAQVVRSNRVLGAGSLSPDWQFLNGVRVNNQARAWVATNSSATWMIVLSPEFAVYEGVQETISLYAQINRAGGNARMYLSYANASGGSLGNSPFFSVSASGRSTGVLTHPAGAARAVMHFEIDPGNGDYVDVGRFMINDGPIAAPFNDAASIGDLTSGQQTLSASVTQQSLAIIDLENQQNIALWRIKAEASGGRPAIIEAYSGLGVSALALGAEQIYFGDNTVFVDATDTMETTIGSVRYIRAQGAPFGPDGLTYWKGPVNVAAAAATKALAESVGGAWEDQFNDSFFGGKTSNGPFDTGSPSASLIVLATGWTTVATVASKYVTANGSFLFRADWQATLSPVTPPSEAPAYGLNWRVISTDLSGGDQRLVASGYVDGLAGISNAPMGQGYTLIEGHVSARGSRRLHLQLAISGSDDVEAASARDARLRGVYYQT